MYKNLRAYKWIFILPIFKLQFHFQWKSSTFSFYFQMISGSCQHWLDYIVAFEKLGEPKKVDIDVNQLWVTRFWDLTSIGIYLFCSMSPLPLSPLRKLLLRSKFRRSSHPTSKKNMHSVSKSRKMSHVNVLSDFWLWSTICYKMRLFWRFSSTLNVYYKVSSAQKIFPQIFVNVESSRDDVFLLNFSPGKVYKFSMDFLCQI